jgi:hypothetical protein
MSVRAPSALRCSALLLAVRLRLKLFGFGRSVAWARRRGGGRGSALPVPEQAELARAAAFSVALAGAFFPGRAVCLEQSLALYVLLRRRGVPAELKLGVQPFPFNAHAWVELDGEPLNEDPEGIARFVPLAEMQP